MDSAATPATPATATENTQLTLAIRVKQEFSKTDSPSKKLVYSPLAGECGYKGPEELRKHSTSRAQPEAQQKALERQDGHSADEWGLSSVKNTTGPTNLVRLERLEVRGPRKRKDEERTYDPKWEGRKNFKKFRRQGKGPGADAGRVRMIIPLVEYVASRRLEGAKSAGSPQPSTSHWPASPSADSSRYILSSRVSTGFPVPESERAELLEGTKTSSENRGNGSNDDEARMAEEGRVRVAADSVCRGMS